MNQLTETKKEIWETILKIDQALVQKDNKTLEDLLADDFIGTVPTGANFKKDAYIKHHCNNNFGIQSLQEETIEKSDIRIYDRTAIINRRVHANFKLPAGTILNYDVQRTEVMLNQNEKWLMIDGQGTQVMVIPQSK